EDRLPGVGVVEDDVSMGYVQHDLRGGSYSQEHDGIGVNAHPPLNFLPYDPAPVPGCVSWGWQLWDGYNVEWLNNVDEQVYRLYRASDDTLVRDGIDPWTEGAGAPYYGRRFFYDVAGEGSCPFDPRSFEEYLGPLEPGVEYYMSVSYLAYGEWSEVAYSEA